MIDWLRKRNSVPERAFEPAELSYPFAFPVIETCASALTAHRTPKDFGMIPERFARKGRVPEMKIASVDGSLRRPKVLSAVCRTGKQLFGQELAIASVWLVGRQ